MEASFCTDQGKIRSHNEDNGGLFYNAAGDLLAVVADGMGGHNAGDVASLMAIEMLKEQWEQQIDASTPKKAEAWLKAAIYEVNERLYDHSITHESCQGMGTTIVAAVCTTEFVTMAHIGDSRLYLYTPPTIQLKTEDHSLVHELMRAGELTEEEAEQHPQKNVLLRALGTEKQVSIDLRTIAWESGDSLLLCSDGLSNKVKQQMMEMILAKECPLNEKAHMFIDLANDLGGEDNISIALVLNDEQNGESG